MDGSMSILMDIVKRRFARRQEIFVRISTFDLKEIP